MSTLQELANKLQEYIIKQQESSGSHTQYALSKYSSVKLKMDSTIRYPHIIIEIGISKAVYNIDNNIKTDGGLGPFDKYVTKWLGSSWILYDIREIYRKLNDILVQKQELNNPHAIVYQEGEADSLKVEAPVNLNSKVNTVNGVKKYLRGYLKSLRKFK